MKKNLFPFLPLLALVLSACSSEQVSSEGAVLYQIYTPATMTVIAETNFATSTVVPIQTATVTFTRTPAATATSTPFRTFSPTTSIAGYAYPIPYSFSNGCPSAAYVGDISVADGAVYAPGETFVKTWKFQNTGTCPWRKKYSIVFRGGDDMGGSDTEIDRVIDPGHAAKISVSLTAPHQEGTYTGYWMLADAGGNAFGNEVYVRIVVSDDAAINEP